MNKLIALAAVVLLALPAAAHGNDRRDDRRADNRGYESVIRDGIRRGELTNNEANRLREQVRALEAMRRSALRDGRLDRGEQQRLARAEDRLEDQMRRELNDRQDRDRFGDRGRDNRPVVIVHRQT